MLYQLLLHHPYHPVISRPEVFDNGLDLMEFRIRLHIQGVFVVHFNGRCPIDRERARERFVVMREDLLLTSASKDTSSGLVSWCFSVVVDCSSQLVRLLTTHELLPMLHTLCSKQLRRAACLNLSHGDFCIRIKKESTTLSQRERHGRALT